jgi:hypothetical protein
MEKDAEVTYLKILPPELASQFRDNPRKLRRI